MAAAQEAPDRVGAEARLERLLGVLEGHHPVILSMRFKGRKVCGGCTKAPHHRRWCNHAAYPRASEEGLHLLFEYCLRGRLLVPGTVSGKSLSRIKITIKPCNIIYIIIWSCSGAQCPLHLFHTMSILTTLCHWSDSLAASYNTPGIYSSA